MKQAGKKPYGGQVIIEQHFSTKEAAERWMEGLKAAYANSVVHVETHLWEPAVDEKGKA